MVSRCRRRVFQARNLTTPPRTRASCVPRTPNTRRRGPKRHAAWRAEKTCDKNHCTSRLFNHSDEALTDWKSSRRVTPNNRLRVSNRGSFNCDPVEPRHDSKAGHTVKTDVIQIVPCDTDCSRGTFLFCPSLRKCASCAPLALSYPVANDSWRPRSKERRLPGHVTCLKSKVRNAPAHPTNDARPVVLRP
ncbi:hypothetical protein BJX66DRAFT_297306 [Aspergillus keveii]|uniref:Uncharacterized protein n=1 Tax=Aspergillus keveii TaxID=714993 RepID=A0ABR4GFI4_9EURO